MPLPANFQELIYPVALRDDPAWNTLLQEGRGAYMTWHRNYVWGLGDVAAKNGFRHKGAILADAARADRNAITFEELRAAIPPAWIADLRFNGRKAQDEWGSFAPGQMESALNAKAQTLAKALMSIALLELRLTRSGMTLFGDNQNSSKVMILPDVFHIEGYTGAAYHAHFGGATSEQLMDYHRQCGLWYFSQDNKHQTIVNVLKNVAEGRSVTYPTAQRIKQLLERMAIPCGEIIAGSSVRRSAKERVRNRDLGV